MMYEDIKNFHKQFEWQPKIAYLEAGLPSAKKLVIIGMGGSGLAGGLLKIFKPDLDIVVHRDYGLPMLSDEELKSRLIILNSYSGNTEEVLESAQRGLEKKLSLVAISTGGKLLKFAKKNQIPYVQLPEPNLQPRTALGYQVKALLKIIGEADDLNKASELAGSLNPLDYENEGRRLARRLKGFVPVIYSSEKNLAIAYTWKIKFNETSKTPAFYNVFPELNHNEINSFDIKDLSKIFYFIFLKDSEDNPLIIKRMEILEKLWRERNLPVLVLKLKAKNIFHKIFSSLVLADWVSYYLAKEYGTDPEQAPIVEEFKKLIK